MTEVEKMLNAAAWRDGIMWAVKDPDVLVAFRDDTGTDLVEPRSPIDRLVDDATGKSRDDLARFVDWFTEEIWGAEMDPRASE